MRTDNGNWTFFNFDIMYCTHLLKTKIKHVQNSFLKVIISLKNQQEVYLVEDDEGVFVRKEKYFQVFNKSSMRKKYLQ